MSKILKAAVTVIKSGKSVRVGSEVLGKGTAKALVAEYKKLSPKAKKTLAAATSVDQAIATAFTLRTAGRGWETSSAYYKSVEEDAEELARMMRSGELDEDTVGDRLDEMADSAMTYTADAIYCCLHSNNDSAIFEEEGSVTVESASDFYTRCGFYAYEADVRDRLSRMDTEPSSPEEDGATDDEE